MVTFVYTAKNTDSGLMVKAEVQAENEQAAAKLLMSQKLFPITIEPKQASGLAKTLPFLNRISSKERVVFTRQLATLINAGLPLVQSLRNIRNQITEQKMQSILDDVIARVEGGSTLSTAFAQHPSVFNEIYVSMVAAGESSGTLDKNLERLANQQEKDAEIVKKIRSALIYPIIVVFVIVAVLGFMLTTVLPQVTKLYVDLGKELPLITRLLVDVSNFSVKYWWINAIMLIALVWGLRNFSKTERGKLFFDNLKMQIPLFGPIYRKVYMARFSRTMSTLLASGIPMLESLRITRAAVNNLKVGDAINRAASKVKGGKALSTTLEDESVFLPLVPQMLAIGEQSGAIDDMLAKVATFYESEVDEEIKNISTTMEPALIVVLGIVVGVIIAAILLPVYSLVGNGVGNLH